jgi:hypothetical protein
MSNRGKTKNMKNSSFVIFLFAVILLTGTVQAQSSTSGDTEQHHPRGHRSHGGKAGHHRGFKLFHRHSGHHRNKHLRSESHSHSGKKERGDRMPNENNLPAGQAGK